MWIDPAAYHRSSRRTGSACEAVFLRTATCGSLKTLRCAAITTPDPAIIYRWWWSQTESNRRPHACKARALPTELWPLERSDHRCGVRLVGPGRLELPTSRLSGVRSNQLSYGPLGDRAAPVGPGARWARDRARTPKRRWASVERETKTADVPHPF